MIEPGVGSPTETNDPAAERLAQAVGEQGRGPYADIFGVLIVDHPPGRVALSVTDVVRGQQLARAAELASPDIDLSRLDIHQCAFSQQAADEVISRLVRLGEKHAGHPIYSYSMSADASGIEVTTNEDGAASEQMRQTLQAASGEMPVRVVRGTPALPL